MRYYAQVVSEAMFADPPMVRGLIDGATIRRLVVCSDSGRKRVFTFDVIGDVRARDLLKRKELVALSFSEHQLKLNVNLLSKRQSIICPGCGLEGLSVDFWHHYNVFHARRMWWINKEHWSRMGFRGDYIPPPEQS